MATYQQSPLTPHIAGKIGGLSFSSSMSGKTIRVRNQPKPKDSYESDLMKSAMYFLQNSWKNLTNSQRENWATYANFRPVEQKRNPGRFINGQQYFIKYNSAYYYQFGTIISDPVFAIDAPFTDTLEINRGLIETNVISTQNIDETNDFVIFKISGSMSPARKQPAGGVKQIKLTFSNSTNCTITGAILDLYGRNYQEGETVFIEYTFFKTQFIQWSNTTRIKVEVQ